MKKTGRNPKIILLILTTVLLSMSFVFIGCGAFEDDNSQPSIRTITDQTLDVDDKITVEVNLTDADIDDIHTINASSDDTIVATVSVNDTSVTITGKTEGMTTITVSATDDSGQDNAAATPVTFKVTVNLPPPPVTLDFGVGINQPPSSFIDKGACTVGMTLQQGESCTYDSKDPFAEIVFSVLHDGTVCREQVPLFEGQIEIPEQLRPRNLKFCVEWDIERDDFFGTNFSASKNPAGSWTVRNVP